MLLLNYRTKITQGKNKEPDGQKKKPRALLTQTKRIGLDNLLPGQFFFVPDNFFVPTIFLSGQFFCPDNFLVRTIFLSGQFFCPDNFFVRTIFLSKHFFCPVNFFVWTFFLSGQKGIYHQVEFCQNCSILHDGCHFLTRLMIASKGPMLPTATSTRSCL